MGHIVAHNDFHLICDKDLDCNSKILNSYCDHNITINRNSSCSCEKGYKYYSKFNKCIFSNHFRCTTAKQCAHLDPRLTCVDNLCTCKEREKRVDNYLCSAFKKYCYKGYRYNVETTDCVFVGDLTLNNQENLDQSVEIFVIVLFFITSALFIASCINNYKNERREKLLRRRLAQQQTMSLFAEQQRRSNFLANTNSITEVVNLANDNLFSNNQFRFDRNNRHYRHSNMFDYHKTNNSTTLFDDLPPSYDDVMKDESSKYYPNSNSNSINHQIITVNNLTISNDTNTLNNNNNNLPSSNDQQQSDHCFEECITNVRVISENNRIDNLVNNENNNCNNNDLNNNNMQTVNNSNNNSLTK